MINILIFITKYQSTVFLAHQLLKQGEGVVKKKGCSLNGCRGLRGQILFDVLKLVNCFIGIPELPSLLTMTLLWVKQTLIIFFRFG